MRAVVVICLAGCSFSTEVPTSAAPDDAQPGAEPTAAAADAAIDTRPLAPCPAPAANCTLLADACLPVTSCYYRCTTNRNREDARVRCEQDGMGCLVTLNDAGENTCLGTVTSPATSGFFWIGFLQTTNTVEPAGGWTWTCGSSAYTPSPPWGLPPPINEPNDSGGNEDCAAMVNNAGHWIDADCNTQMDYVCEFPR